MMRLHCRLKWAMLLMSVFALKAVAQQAVVMKEAEKSAVENTVPAKTESTKSAAITAETNKATASKKMVQDATINLQTTITGNQEQPKVLYVLPWQSPQMAVVDFEPLDNQQKAVFNHVERDELRRELDAADESQ